MYNFSSRTEVDPENRAENREILDKESPASAMVGSVGVGAHGFFGDSSAGNFVSQLRKAVALRGGTSSRSAGNATSQPPILEIHRKRSNQKINLDQCALPPKSRADTLLSIYWDAVHPLYPFVDRVVMALQYNSVFSGDTSAEKLTPSLMCTLNIIFALSCQLDTSTTSAGERERSASIFFKRAQGCLDLWKMEASVETVQILLLFSQYLQSTNEPLQCWIFVGSAIRMAQSLGMHLTITTLNEPSLQRREIMRRVWHACILLERILAMTYGRPTMVSRAVAFTSPLPLAVDEEDFSIIAGTSPPSATSPSRIDFFIASLNLYDILHQLLDTSYSNLHHTNIAEGATSFMDIDKKLMSWESFLPPHLKLGPLSWQESLSSSPNSIFRRQAVILRQRFLHVRLMSLRPILSAQVASESSDIDIQTTPTNIGYRIAHQCSVACVMIAQEAIQLIFEHHASSTGLLAAWWYNVFFVYSAATVLVAARLRPALESEISQESIEGSWRQALSIMNAYRDYSESNPTLIATLQLLYQEFPERYSQVRMQLEQQAQGHPLMGSSHFTARETGLPNHDVGETGVPENLPDFDFAFDTTDMSWLYSVPNDF